MRPGPNRLEYEKRVNRVIDHVRDHLAEDLPLERGYEPDDRPCLELYRGNPQVGGRPGTFRADLCVPVRPL